MYTVGLAAQVPREMEQYRLDLMGLSEIRRTGAGRIKMRNGFTMIYAGEESERQRGVAITISQATQKSLIEWTLVSNRIITARFYSRFKNTTVIQVYAPTNESTDDEKDDFYDQLQATFDTCNRHDVVIVMGDLNAKVGEFYLSDHSRQPQFGQNAILARSKAKLRNWKIINCFFIYMYQTLFTKKNEEKLSLVSKSSGPLLAGLPLK